MTTIKLSQAEELVLTFDGNVLELFSDRSHRIHVTWFERIEIKKDLLGLHSIVIHYTGGLYTNPCSLDENAIPKVTSLIAEIERAKAAFQFD